MLGIILFVLLFTPVHAVSLPLPGSDSVTLVWNDNLSSEKVTGYRVYYGIQSRSYSNSVTVEQGTSGTVSGLAGDVTYFFAVTAYDAFGLESGFSDEVTYRRGSLRARPVEHAAAGMVRTMQGLPGHTYDIWSAHPLLNRTFIGRVTVGASGSATFSDPAPGSLTSFYDIEETPPGVQILEASETELLLNVTGQSGHTYDVRATQDFRIWTVVGRVTVGASGSEIFSHLHTTGFSMRFYDIEETPSAVEVVNVSEPEATLFVTGQSGRTYNIRASRDSETWTIIGRVTIGDGGSEFFSHANAASFATGLYDVEETPPAVVIASYSEQEVLMQVTGQSGRTYDVRATRDFQTWTVIGRVTLGASGSATFTDPAPGSWMSFYETGETQPALEMLHVSGGEVLLGVTGQSGSSYQIQASQDLLHWSALGTVTLERNGEAHFIDASAGNNPARHYRIQILQR